MPSLATDPPAAPPPVAPAAVNDNDIRAHGDGVRARALAWLDPARWDIIRAETLATLALAYLAAASPIPASISAPAPAIDQAIATVPAIDDLTAWMTAWMDWTPPARKGARPLFLGPAAPELIAEPVAVLERAAAPPIPGHITHVTENDAPEPAPAPKEVMPKDLTFDEVIYWQIEHGEDRPFYIAEAARDHQGRVTQRMFHLAEVGKLLMRNERGMTRYDVVRVIPAATTADTACTA